MSASREGRIDTTRAQRQGTMRHLSKTARNEALRGLSFIDALLVAVGLLIVFDSFAAGASLGGTPYRAEILDGDAQARQALQQGQLDDALTHWLRARNIADTQHDYLASAALSNEIGGLYERVERLQEALREYERGLRTLADQRGGSATTVERALAELRASEKTYTESNGDPLAPDLYRGEVGDLTVFLQQPAADVALLLRAVLGLNAGNLYLGQTQYEQAQLLYDTALTAARDRRVPSLERRILTNRAWGAIQQNRFQEASDLLDRALRQLDPAAPPIELRRALLAVGVYRREQGEYTAAITHIDQARTLYGRAADAVGQARALAHLATTYQQQGRLQLAKRLYHDALRLNEQLNKDAIAWHTHGGLAKTYRQLGDLAAASEHYELYMDAVDRLSVAFRTDQGRVSLLEDHAGMAREYVDVAVDLAQTTGDFTTARRAIERGRARALEDLLRARIGRQSTKAGNLPAGPFLFGDDWERVRYEFAGGVDVSQMAPGVGGFAPPPEQTALGVSSPHTDTPAATSDTADSAVASVPFLETYVLVDRTVLLIKTGKDPVRGAVVSVGEKHLNELVDRYRLALAVQHPRGVKVVDDEPSSAYAPSAAPHSNERQLARELYTLLIEPIEQFLPQAADEPVIIVPHQSLWLLPFAALRDQSDRLLADRHALAYAVSESSWQTLARRPRPADHRRAKAWIVGNPTMAPVIHRCGLNLSFSALPGAEAEAREIADIFGPERAELFVGAQADRLRIDAWHSEFSILHFASHGIACPDDPLSSFIVLRELGPGHLDFDPRVARLTIPSDSRFPVTLSGARELLSSPLFSATPRPSYPGLLDARKVIQDYGLAADLVTLSACQTGLGRLTGEGLIGFTRAFLAAGARSLLVSQWSVDDRSTRYLMGRFYEAYLQHGNKGLALQKAMAETRKLYPAAKHWAGFSLIGLVQ